uniref:Tail fiber domain-containing protein n=1 Tax=Globodera pallida TaxID=36090 RepID=A0A183BXR2_GLOPA
MEKMATNPRIYFIKTASKNGLTRPSSAADKRVYRPAGDILVAARPDEEMGMFLSFMGPRLGQCGGSFWMRHTDDDNGYTIAKGNGMVRSFEFYADRDLIVHDDSRAQVGLGINVWGSFRFMRSDVIHSSSISTDQRFDSR